MNARSPLAVAPAKTKKLKVVPNEATTQTSHHVDEIEDSNPDFVTAIGRGFAILRCFKRNAKVLGNKELAEMTGLPKSTVARLTFTLTKLGYLNFLPAIEKYELGIGVLTLGQTYLSGLDAREVARPLMQELANYAGATVTMGAPHGQDMVFLEICHGNQVFMMRVAVGQRVPHGMTALGRAYIAALTPEQRAKYSIEYRPRVKPDEWKRQEEGRPPSDHPGIARPREIRLVLFSRRMEQRRVRGRRADGLQRRLEGSRVQLQRTGP